VRSRPLDAPARLTALLDSFWELAVDVAARTPQPVAAPPPTPPTPPPAPPVAETGPQSSEPAPAGQQQAYLNPPSPTSGVRFGEASHPGPVEPQNLSDLEATEGVRVLRLPPETGLPCLICVIMPDNTEAA
jgi:hypothetical protein